MSEILVIDQKDFEKLEENGLYCFSKIEYNRFMSFNSLDKNNEIFKNIWDEAYKKGFECLKDKLK